MACVSELNRIGSNSPVVWWPGNDLGHDLWQVICALSSSPVILMPEPPYHMVQGTTRLDVQGTRGYARPQSGRYGYTLGKFMYFIVFFDA